MISLRGLLLAFPILLASGNAFAIDQLVTTEIDPKSVPSEIVVDNRERVRDGLPDGRIARASAGFDILEAWYSEPTTRYRHGVLGDSVEAGALKVRNSLGQTITFRLPPEQVFEDITPRLADLDGDNRLEIITIRSSRSSGAALTVYGLNSDVLEQKASTPFIGRANRWLNVAAIANMVPGRNLEIAIVVMPHLRGELQVIQYPSGRLVENSFRDGFSNHFIGSRELRLSAVTDYSRNRLADIALPSLDRNSLIVVGFQGGKIRKLAQVGLPSQIDKAIAVKSSGNDVEYTVGTEDGKVYRITRN